MKVGIPFSCSLITFIPSFLLFFAATPVYSQQEYKTEVKEIVRGQLNRIWIREGPLYDAPTAEKYTIEVDVPLYLEVNAQQLRLESPGSGLPRYLTGEVTVFPQPEAPTGIVHCTIILNHTDEGRQYQLLQLAIPIKVVSQQEVMTKKAVRDSRLAGTAQHIGLIAGGNVYSFWGDDVRSSTGNGFSFGAVLDLKLGGPVAIRLEPMFSRRTVQRAEFSESIANPPEGLPIPIFIRPEYEARLSFLEVPVLLKLTLPTKQAQPYLLAGPSLGLLLSADGVLSVPTLRLVSERENIEGITNFIDFGISMGAGINAAIGPSILFFEGRYTVGLTRIFDDGKTSVGPDEPSQGVEFEVVRELDVKFRGLQLMAGIAFPIVGY